MCAIIVQLQLSKYRKMKLDTHVIALQLLSNTVNSLQATTSRKRLPPVSDHLVTNRFVYQSNTVSKTLS